VDESKKQERTARSRRKQEWVVGFLNILHLDCRVHVMKKLLALDKRAKPFQDGTKSFHGNYIVLCMSRESFEFLKSSASAEKHMAMHSYPQ